MKTKKTLNKIVAAAALAFASIAPVFAQSNLGQDCGCPTPVSSRPTVLMSTLADTAGNLTAISTILDCAHTYILDRKIYVGAGKTIDILPGTVVKGRFFPSQTQATALVISRGARINAVGSPTCQVVFTAEADNLDGTYPISNTCQWGGLVIAGRASNCLRYNPAGPASDQLNGPYQPGLGDGKLCMSTGLAEFEGFATTDLRFAFGADLLGTFGPAESFDDNDNSGILRYVSVRHAGAVLAIGGELNGISLGSVGRGTSIDHVETVSAGDDNMEFWGGTVNIKYFAGLFGRDDMFDWDDGYSGKVQFAFAIAPSDTTWPTTVPSVPTAVLAEDNGFEMDADDQKSNYTPRSHPIIYNATMIGNGKRHRTSDNSGPAAMRAKELTEGEIYNSIFAKFRYGLCITKALSGNRSLPTGEAWHNWANSGGNGSQSLKVKCNQFVGMVEGDIVIDQDAAGTLLTSDTAQFYTTDHNTTSASLPGFTPTWSMNPTTNLVTTRFDAIPNPAITNQAGCTSAPADGFYTPVTYKGAFASSGQSWLSPWSYTVLLNTTPGLQPCPTDINGDGITNTVDFLLLLAQFNQSCQ